MGIRTEFQVQKTAYAKSLVEGGEDGAWQGYWCGWEAEKGGGDVRQDWRQAGHAEC